MLRSGGVWYGGRDVLRWGMVWYGKAVEACYVEDGWVRLGPFRRSWCVPMWRVPMWRGPFGRSRLGVAQRGPMWRGVARRDS